MKKLVSLVIICLLFTVLQFPSQAQDAPPVLAFYYAWFDETTWTSGQSVDLPAQPYRSADRAVIEKHVAQAQGAGINAFVQSWYGPQEQNNQTEPNFRMLLDIAAQRNFQAAVHFETAGPFFADRTAVVNGLQHLLATHAQHPGYLRYQGKPVIFFWRQQRFSVDTWAAIRQQLDPNHTTFWIAEGVDIAYQAVFDGHHLYSIAWAGSPAAQLAKWGDRVRAYENQHGVDRLWVATAMPGYNDTKLPRADAFAVARRGGAYYRETWQGAVASQPDMLIVTSFNEWLEGTQLEPSVSYGTLYLDLTRELVASLRGNPAPAPAAQRAAEVQTASPQAASPAQQNDGPVINVPNITNVRQLPTTTAPRIGTLAAGSTVAVTGKLTDESWWQIEFEAAEEGVGWVSAEVVEFNGDAEAVPVIEVDMPAEETAPEEEAPAVAEEETADPEAAETEAEEETPAEDEAPAEEAEAEEEAEEEAEATEESEEPPAEDDADEVPAALEEITEAEPDPEAQADLLLPTIDVTVNGVNVRNGPSTEFDRIGRLDSGQTAIVVGRGPNNEWWQIEFEAAPDGVGWVAAEVVEFNGDPASVPLADDLPVMPIGEIEATDPVNVRAEPNTEGSLLGGLYPGETAGVLAVSPDGEWWQITFADATEGTGWVAADFVVFTGDEGTIPVFGVGTPTPTPGPTDTPTATPLPSPTATETPVDWPPTYAPSPTSVYQATSEAMLAERGTPEPEAEATPVPGEESAPAFGLTWQEWPWGILAALLVILFFWYQFSRSRRR